MRRAAPGAAVVLVAGAVAAGAAVASSPQLSTGTPSFAGVPVTTLDGYGAQGMHVVDYRHGQVLRLSLPVTNTGRVPITVTGADLGEGPIALLTVRGVEAVRVPAGSTRAVTVEAVLGECRFFHERETQTYRDLALEVSALGRTSTRTVALDRPLLVHSPMIVGCPDRKLNRQADNRTS